MKRRDFFDKSLAAAAGAALLSTSSCAPAEESDTGSSGPAVHARPTIRWRLSSSFPPSLDTIYGSSEVLAERVAALTDDKFQIRPYAAGEIVPAMQVLDAVQQGTTQVGQTASYYFTGKNPALAFDTCYPFGLTARQQDAWLAEGGGRELINELFSDFNLITFPAGNTGAQMGGWFREELTGLNDLNGLIMRIPGLGGEVMSELGVTPQVIPGGEIYPALEKGAVDATEWVGPYDDEKLGFHQVATYYYYPGWWEPGPSLSFYVNEREWNELPSSYQEVFESAAVHAAHVMQTRYDSKNPKALERLLEHGVQLRRFPDEVMQAARDAAEALLEQSASKSKSFRKVYESWKGFRTDSFRWFGTAELAYADFTFPRPTT